MTSPLKLATDAIHLGGLRQAVAVPDFNHDYERYIREYCREDGPGRLICIAESTTDWPSWEIHPEGDEIVIVLRGRAEFIQNVGGSHQRVLVGPNEAVINPAGVPHTANVLEPFTALYITPGPGTTHEPRSSTDG